MKSSIYSRFAVAAIMLAAVGSVQSIRAASASWNALPTNNNWIAAPTTNNWSTGAGTFPGTNSGTSSPDIATFNANSSQTTVNCASAWVVGGIVFDTANASAYTINTSAGTWRVSLGGNANGAVIRTTGTVVNKETITGTLRLASSGTISVISDAATPAATLNITTGCSVNNSGNSGTLVLGGTNSGPNIMGAYIEQTPATIWGTLIKTNTGMWILASSNTYHSNTIVTGGTLLLMGSGAIGNSANIIVRGGALNISNVISNPNNMWVTNSGVLAVTNAIAAQTQLSIGTLTTENATIQLGVNGASPYNDITVNNAFNAGPNTTLAITKVVNVTSPTTFTLLYYGGADPNPANFTVTVPQGYTASSFSVGGGAITVTITPPITTALVWVGQTNSVLVSNWDTNKTQNWIDAATLSVPQAYSNPDPVQFDDTAANTNVTLLTTNIPESLDVNTYNLNYIFSGPGKISGATSLTKEGYASLTLADNGDDFGGGIVVNGGTVILDNTNGNISGGLTINYGTTVQIGNDDGNGALPAGQFDDGGTLIFQKTNNYTVPFPITGTGALTQNGNGKLTLNTTNPYTGLTIVSKGTLALVGGGAVSNSYGLLVSNATFDVSGVSSTTLLNDFSITNARINVSAASALQVPVVVSTFEADGIMAFSNIVNVAALPTITSYPVTLTLIKSANPIYLANGNFNFALGTLPAASPAYRGHLVQSADQTSVQLTLTAGPVAARSSVTWAGIDNTTTTTNWSDRDNWQLPGAPGATDNVIFGPGSSVVPNYFTVNNFVDTNFAISTLTYNQTTSGQWHVTQIQGGNTLTVSGATVIGGQSGDGFKTSVAMVDAGTLTLNNNLTIGNIGVSTADSGTTLDLSGLSNFVYNAYTGTITLGPNNRSTANFLLAGVSNKITAGTINANVASSSSTASGTLTLGPGTNILNVGTLNIAAQRTSCTMQFPAGAAGGGLRMRGALGNEVSRANVALGNRNAGSSSGGTTTGTLSLNGSLLDVKLGTLTLGECNQGAGLIGDGVLNFDTGVIDVTSILMAVNSGAGSATGEITIGANATLIIGKGGASLANQTSTGTATGSITDNGGLIVCSNSIFKTTASGSTANITFNGGTLNILGGTVGTEALPIDNLVLNDGTILDLNGIPGSPAIAANIAASGTITVNINAFGDLGTAQTEVPLIYYTGSDPYANLALGSVPPGYIVGNGGVLVDNTANQTIDIIVTPPPAVTYVPVSARTFQLSWPAERIGWRLVVQTNTLGAGLNMNSNAWYTVPGSASVNTETITIDTNKPSVFYRLTYP